MMNKKLLIASIFATLMLLVPMTSIVGSTEIKNSNIEKLNFYNVEKKSIIDDKSLILLEKNFAFLSIVINIIKLRFSRNQWIKSQCEDIQIKLDVFNRGIFDNLCKSLQEVLIPLEDLLVSLYEIGEWIVPFLFPLLITISALAMIYNIFCQ